MYPVDQAELRTLGNEVVDEGMQLAIRESLDRLTKSRAEVMGKAVVSALIGQWLKQQQAGLQEQMVAALGEVLKVTALSFPGSSVIVAIAQDKVTAKANAWWSKRKTQEADNRLYPHRTAPDTYGTEAAAEQAIVETLKEYRAFAKDLVRLTKPREIRGPSGGRFGDGLDSISIETFGLRKRYLKVLDGVNSMVAYAEVLREHLEVMEGAWHERREALRRDAPPLIHQLVEKSYQKGANDGLRAGPLRPGQAPPLPPKPRHMAPLWQQHEMASAKVLKLMAHAYTTGYFKTYKPNPM